MTHRYPTGRRLVAPHCMRAACSLLLLAGIHAPSLAQGAAPKKPVELDEVVVTATRTEADMNDVPASISRIGRAELDRRQPRDEADLFKDEPDIAFTRDMRRFGSTRVNVRGVEDVRVVQMVDGVRVGDAYEGGGPTNYTTVPALGTSLDFLKRVEVLRGPASSLYGSDALGGVVGYFTLDPVDITGRDKTQGGRLKATYNGANNGTTLTGIAAGRGEQVDFLIGLTGTHFSETETKGNVGGYSTNRTQANPQKGEDQGLLAKLHFRPGNAHAFKLEFEHRRQDVDTSVQRAVSSLPKVTRMDGDDNAKRARLSLDWVHTPAAAFYDRMAAKFYIQDRKTDNYNSQSRTNTSATCSASTGTGNNCLLNQFFQMEQTAAGANVQFDKAFAAGAVEHLLSYGADAMFMRTKNYQDATGYNLTAGTTLKTLAGETYPRRAFPTGETTNLGLFVQDEMQFDNGRYALTPGLRFDHRTLEPKGDALSEASLAAVGTTAVKQTHNAWSPKLAGLWKLDSVYSLWGQVVKGFRAPNYDEVNSSFRNTVQGYGNVPNPNLRPETSVTTELGLRWASREVKGQVAVFNSDYKNYIENLRLNCSGAGADPQCIAGTTYTYINRNLDRVNIRGIELRSAWAFARNWQLGGAIARMVGRDESTDQPLNTIEPTRLTLALTYDNSVWGAEGRVRAASSKRDVSDWAAPNRPTADPWFRVPGYAVLDMTVWAQLSKGVKANLGVNNVFDQKYWLWSDIRRADARDPAGVEFYSQPGRHLVASVQVDF